MISQEIQAQVLLWVVKEERNRELGELVQDWREYSLSRLPPCLAYLVLDCGQVAGYPVALGWLSVSCASHGVHDPRENPAEVAPDVALEIARSVIALRRRRDRILPSWRRDYQRLTNRTNRVAERVLHLVKAQIRETIRSHS